jgi:hypothetical protein
MHIDTETDLEDKWDGVLADLPAVRGDLADAQRDRGLVRRGVPICPVARPGLVSPFLAAADMAASETVTAALVKATEVVRSDSRLRDRYLGDLHERFGRFTEHDPGTPSGCVIGRLDGFRAGSDLAFFEYNSEAVGTHSLSDAIADVFAHTHVMDRLRREHFIGTPSAFADLVRSLRGLHAELASGEELTTVHMLTSVAAAPTGADLDDEWFAAHGLTCLRADPRSLEWDGVRLTAGGTPVRAAIRMFDLGSVEDLADVEALRAAERAGAVTLLNPLSTVAHGAKAVLAALTDPHLDLGLPTALRNAVRLHVPWTRLVVDEATTNPQGDRIDLLAWASYNRADLVLKPSLGHGGCDVILGRRTGAGAWQQALARAAQADAVWVVQAAVPVHLESFPLLDGNCGEFVVELAPLLHRGRYAGTVCRLSGDPNGHGGADAAIMPSFVVD